MGGCACLGETRLVLSRAKVLLFLTNATSFIPSTIGEMFRAKTSDGIYRKANHYQVLKRSYWQSR
jgi:hypothetical protein